MTSVSSFERGMNKVPGEPGLNVYVAADGALSAYYKGRVNGKPVSIKLDGDGMREWTRECSRLRGDTDAAEKKAGSRTVKVGDYAVGRYQEKQEARVGHMNLKLRRSRRAVANDKQRIEQFIVGTKLGRMKIGDVKVEHVRVWLEGMYALRKADGEHYAQGTIGDILRILGSVFREAKRDGHATFNPVRELESDERPDRNTPKNEKRYLTDEQIELLLDEVSETFQPVLQVCWLMALRVSETLGLVWGDINFDEGSVAIDRQLDGSERVATKTSSSKTTLYPQPGAMDVLREHRRTMAARGLQHVGPNALVFVTWNGLPQSRRNVLRALQNAADKLGMNTDPLTGEALKKVDIHSLRHSFISNGLEDGMTLPEMAQLARHSNPRTTATMYSKVPEAHRRSTAQRLHELRLQRA